MSTINQVAVCNCLHLFFLSRAIFPIVGQIQKLLTNAMGLFLPDQEAVGKEPGSHPGASTQGIKG